MRRFGYIDTGGEWLVKPRFVKAGSFNGGYAKADSLFRDSPSPDEAGCSIDRSGSKLLTHSASRKGKEPKMFKHSEAVL